MVHNKGYNWGCAVITMTELEDAGVKLTREDDIDIVDLHAQIAFDLVESEGINWVVIK